MKKDEVEDKEYAFVFDAVNNPLPGVSSIPTESVIQQPAMMKEEEEKNLFDIEKDKLSELDVIWLMRFSIDGVFDEVVCV